ncbi:hypothetical protein CWR43_29955 [Rhizobium sullae]|uniref:Uncharacterized protein n=1 Tax=Rhizobium sullae TaxID=50338 RepID=A0A2N0D1B4_RHISU|nr:hypothetical protein [Rhizobium sullae]PKA39904.1 hypothetical protein CWR43_29955 [Rhizobium sullae]
MRETETRGWATYQPSKSVWAWSVVGASVLTMIVGFTWGGWTTGGRASVMADIAARNARAGLVADMCVEKFVSSADAAANLKALKAASSWERDSFIEKGGWTTIAGVEKSIPNAADRCAEALIEMKEIPAQETSVTDS